MPYLLQISLAATGCCDRCRSEEAAGFVLRDAQEVTKFFCERCVIEVLVGCLPAGGKGRRHRVDAASAARDVHFSHP